MNYIDSALEWWRSRLDSLADLQGKVRLCYDETDLVALFDLPTARPYAGVVYDSSVGLPTIAPSNQTGVVEQLVVAIVLCFDTMEMGADSRPLNYQSNLLVAVRKLAMSQPGPNGKAWRFVRENSPGSRPSNKLKVWVQGWALPLIASQQNLSSQKPRVPGHPFAR